MEYKNLGKVLKEARLYQRLDIKHISQVLKIKESHLEALESGSVEQLKGVYLSGYIRSYAEWLGLNGDEILAQFRLAQGRAIVSGPMGSVMPLPAPALLQHEGSAFQTLRLWTTMVGGLVIAVILWHQVISPEIQVTPRYHPLIEESIKKESLVPYQGKKMIFIAESDVQLSLLHKQGEKKEQFLHNGDVFFITYDLLLDIAADKPEKISVFLEDNNNQFLGSVKELF